MKIIILGSTGSGKGTQAKFISKLLKLEHIDVGKHFRKIANKNKKIKEYIMNGILVPDRVVLNLINKLIKNKKNYILDGFPRNLSQAKKFHDKIDLVLFLKVDKKNLIIRLLKRRREDDNLNNIHERFKVYLKQTLPVIRYYSKKKVLVTVNGNSSIKNVSKEIKKIFRN